MNAEYMRKYREEHPNYVPRTKEASKAYQEGLKDKAVELLGGYVCVNCGCTEKSILEINHISGGGTQERRKIQRKRFLLNIIDDEARREHYNILCRVCNAQHYIEHILGIKGHTITWK